jgi:hypothetical protein
VTRDTPPPRGGALPSGHGRTRDGDPAAPDTGGLAWRSWGYRHRPAGRGRTSSSTPRSPWTRRPRADVGLHYELAATWHEDVTFAGADTILAQELTGCREPAAGLVWLRYRRPA